MRQAKSSASPTRPGKIQDRHLDRLAVVYVRQSTLRQVHFHRESTRLQYGLHDSAVALGWRSDQVLTIDDDLGRSGANIEGRPGFQRLVAEVTLGHVGAVLGLEMSRLARSCRDWYQLLEVCAMFGTLIVDLDGIYDPAVYNDRLLLGLKGTMSEAELYGIKQRMQQGRLAKAERGELAMRLPMGYLRRPSGEVIKDPDEQARSAVGLIFELFERVQTAGAVYRKLLAEGVQMPCRLAAGPRKGDLDWRQPSLATVREVLRNPVYAGAFVYGRRRTDARRQQPGRLGTGRIATPREQWQVLLQDRLPAYISWEQYEQNQRQLRANNTRNKGVVRHGPSLLSGLLICGLCGRRLTTRYVNKGTSHRYCCEQLWVLRKGPACQSLVGDVLDARVAELVLAALEPAALELSIQVAGNHDAERRRLDEHWRLRLEKARYDSERARRQYEAVEPENRLVARTLERAWEDALRAAQALEQEHTRFLAARPSALSASDRDTIRALAQSIPTLWHAPTTTAADRQSLVRQLIDKVVVTVIDGTEHVALEVHWHGGHTTADSLVRPVRRLDQLRNGEELTRRAVELFQDGHTGAEVAEVLSSEGWRPASRRPQFTRDMVYALIQRHGRVARRRRPGITERQPNEWTIIELSEKIGMPRPTLQVWIRDSDLPRRRIGNGRGTWLVTADAAEISRLKERRAQRLAKNRDISS